jgi:hypothetical protein
VDKNFNTFSTYKKNPLSFFLFLSFFSFFHLYLSYEMATKHIINGHLLLGGDVTVANGEIEVTLESMPFPSHRPIQS